MRHSGHADFRVRDFDVAEAGARTDNAGQACSAPIVLEDRGAAAMSNGPPRLRDDIVQLIPSLRAFARALTRNHNEADDLLQDTLLKALANIHQFTPGTNLRSWLFTIQRNTFYTNYKKKRREHASPIDESRGLSSEPTQDWTLMMGAVHTALHHLPVDQREALILVGGAGFSYEEAARICGCALGTIKSRVSRARARMVELLEAK